MNKGELVSAILSKVNEGRGEDCKLRKQHVVDVVDSLLETVKDTLSKGEKVQIVGFGSFETRQRKAREGRNPKKPEEVIHIPASKAPVFKAGKSLKDAVNK